MNVKVFTNFRTVTPEVGAKIFESKDKLIELGFIDIEKSIYEAYYYALLPEGWKLEGDVQFQGGTVRFIDDKNRVRFEQWAKCYDNMHMYGDFPVLQYFAV